TFTHNLCLTPELRGRLLPTSLDLEQHARRALYCVLDAPEEGYGLASVDDPVVVGERHVHHRSDNHLAITSHRSLLDGMHPEHARLRWVDYRRRHQRTENAAVTDGEGAAAELVRQQLVVSGPLSEVGDLLLDLGERQPLGVANHGHN